MYLCVIRDQNAYFENRLKFLYPTYISYDCVRQMWQQAYCDSKVNTIFLIYKLNILRPLLGLFLPFILQMILELDVIFATNSSRCISAYIQIKHQLETCIKSKKSQGDYVCHIILPTSNKSRHHDNDESTLALFTMASWTINKAIIMCNHKYESSHIKWH